MDMTEIRTFVAGLFLATTEGREPMTYDDAIVAMEEWIREGWEDIPSGLTPRLLADIWNECLTKGD